MQPGYHRRAGERWIGMPQRHQNIGTAASYPRQSADGDESSFERHHGVALLPGAILVTDAPDRRLANPGGVDLRRSAQGLNASVTDDSSCKQRPAGPRGAAERQTVGSEFAMRGRASAPLPESASLIPRRSHSRNEHLVGRECGKEAHRCSRRSACRRARLIATLFHELRRRDTSDGRPSGPVR
jgi:hypothetical protein